MFNILLLAPSSSRCSFSRIFIDTFHRFLFPKLAFHDSLLFMRHELNKSGTRFVNVPYQTKQFRNILEQMKENSCRIHRVHRARAGENVKIVVGMNAEKILTVRANDFPAGKFLSKKISNNEKRIFKSLIYSCKFHINLAYNLTGTVLE